MANYELRADIMSNGKDLYDLIAGCNRVVKLYNFGNVAQKVKVSDKYKFAVDTLKECFLCYGSDFVNEVIHLAECNYNRVERLRNILYKICDLYEQPIFITLTFDDSKVSPDVSIIERHNMCYDYMKSLGAYFVGNDDYGNLRERYHAHFVFVRRLTREEMSRWFDTHGAINVENIRKDVESDIRLGRYVNKLVNHAVKSTTKQSRLMFSRKYHLPLSESEQRSKDLATSRKLIRDKERILELEKDQEMRLFFEEYNRLHSSNVPL